MTSIALEKRRQGCRDYYRRHKDHLLERTKRWKAANRERVRELGRKWDRAHPRDRSAYYTANRERFRITSKAWRLANREKVKGYTKKWRAKNRDKVNATHKRWAAKKTPVFLHNKHKYRAAKRSVHLEFCGGKIALLKLERFCHWCCTRLSDTNRHIDHVIPLTRGGLHIPDNLVASCVQCNVRRHNKLVSEWLPYQEFDLSYQGV